MIPDYTIKWFQDRFKIYPSVTRLDYKPKEYIEEFPYSEGYSDWNNDNDDDSVEFDWDKDVDTDYIENGKPNEDIELGGSE